MRWLKLLERFAEWMMEQGEIAQKRKSEMERTISRYMERYQNLSDRELIEKGREAKEKQHGLEYRACILLLQERGVIKPKEKSE